MYYFGKFYSHDMSVLRPRELTYIRLPAGKRLNAWKTRRKAGDNVFRWLCRNKFLSLGRMSSAAYREAINARGVVYGTMHSGFRNE